MSGWFLKQGVRLDPKLALTDPTALFHLRRMLDIAARTAPEVLGESICCTSISRVRGRGKTFSYHGEGRAVDIRTGLTGTSEDDIEWHSRLGAIVAETGTNYVTCVDWAARIRSALGDGYDVVYGFAVQHTSHIHIERDSRDG